MAVTLPAEALAPYARFSLYNSPYPSHRRGCAVDLYPAGARVPAGGDGAGLADAVAGRDRSTAGAPSPVTGEVLETRTVRAPTRAYAEARDHLILVDAGRYVARILHVEPAVTAGDRLEYGDPLGRLVRSGYFAPWVGNHVHLGFRSRSADRYRAAGSLPVEPAVAVEPVAWDGTGTVVATGATYAVLDAPAHPAPGERFAAVATDGGRPLDGGVVHYAGGGRPGTGAAGEVSAARRDGPPGGDATCGEPVSLLGCEVGTATGRDVSWADVAIRANGERLTGLSLSAAREALGAKLIARDHDLAVGDRVTVSVEAGEPVRLG